MNSSQKLLSVSHNIAAHASSGLSYIHPHIEELCKKAGISFVNINILDQNPYPAELADYAPLKHSLKGLHKKFIEILHKEGSTINEISAANVIIQFTIDVFGEYHENKCYAIIKATNGKEYSSNSK